MDARLGIDIGGSGIKGAPVDLVSGALAADRRRIPTPQPALAEPVSRTLGKIVGSFSGVTGPIGCAFPGIVISEVVKDYSDFRLLAKKAQAQVDAGRADRESVLGQTQEFMETYRRLREAVDVLDAGRDDLEAKREINRKADRQFVLTLVTRISLGILAAAVVLIVALWPQ